jgi:glycosyltransferase involved in cell wall biosynthesis
MLQLLREWPPGYGGVERVAHELALEWQRLAEPCTVYSLVAQPAALAEVDPLPVPYRRVPLPRWALGRLLIPLPSAALLRLLLAPEPLHAHLPCPAVLALVLLARLLRPRRAISLHWHSFLEPAPTPAGRLFGLYQRLAERLLPLFPRIITTSPPLQQELLALGLASGAVRVVACSLPGEQEQQAGALAAARLAVAPPGPHPAEFRLLSISRLDSYKRVDWLIEALAAAQALLPPHGPSLRLDVVGDGPDRLSLEGLAQAQAPGRVQFHGRLDEGSKRALLARADLLVLAANRCNEAFGIVQLEAMACAVPALAFEHPRSGMHWVSRLPALSWDGRRSSLAPLIARLVLDPALLALVRSQARQRYSQVFSRSVWQAAFRQAFAP